MLTREFWNEPAARPMSLLNAWHDVRDWRHAFNEAETLAPQIIHAHSFASGMAAVRGTVPVVYQFSCTLQEIASQQSGAPAGAWLLRSLCVAEQFVLARAGAVVVPCQAMKSVAVQAGATEGNVFFSC